MDEFMNALSINSVSVNKLYNEDSGTSLVYFLVKVKLPEVPAGYELAEGWQEDADGNYLFVNGFELTVPEGD